jgi:biotin carboxylase
MKKRLLIISGGIEAVPIIERAGEMGLCVIVADGDEDAPGFEVADESVVVSTYDREAMADVAETLARDVPIDGVLSAAADVPQTVAAVAGRLGLQGPSSETAFLATDKLAMKEALKAAGVAVPWFAQVASPEEIKKIIKRMPEKNLVIKPVDSRGARGVARLLPDVEIEWAFDQAREQSPSGRVMVEEWLKGRQISTESIYIDGKIVTPGLSDRNYEYLDRYAPYVIENGGDLPAELTSGERSEIDIVLTQAATAMGVERGTIKGDVVVTEDGPFIIELAVRLSGGYFCSHTIPLSMGTDIVGAAIRIALGEKVDIKKYVPQLKGYVSQRFVFPEPGLVSSVDISEDVASDTRIVMSRIYAKPGDRVELVVSHPCRSGMYVAVADTRENAIAAAEMAVEGTCIKTVVEG